jgi:hypothetical protein
MGLHIELEVPPSYRLFIESPIPEMDHTCLLTVILMKRRDSFSQSFSELRSSFQQVSASSIRLWQRKPDTFLCQSPVVHDAGR